MGGYNYISCSYHGADMQVILHQSYKSQKQSEQLRRETTIVHVEQCVSKQITKFSNAFFANSMDIKKEMKMDFGRSCFPAQLCNWPGGHNEEKSNTFNLQQPFVQIHGRNHPFLLVATIEELA